MAVVARGFAVGVLAFLLAGTTAVLAQAMGRLSGKVVDSDGNPIRGVVVSLTMEGLESASRSLQTKTNKRGKFVLSVADATVVYRVTLQAEGYATLMQRLKLTPQDTTFEQFVLQDARAPDPSDAGPPGSGAAASPARADPALAAYNRGVAAFRRGELAPAADALTVAIEHDPDLILAHSTLSLVYLRQERFAEAADTAERTLELDAGDFKALLVRYQACRELGDDQRSERARRALQAAGAAGDAARRVFNEAADAYNLGDIERAQALFAEALALDEGLERARVALTQIDLREGRFELAHASAVLLLEARPDDPEALDLRYAAARGLGTVDALGPAVGGLLRVDPSRIVDVEGHAADLMDAENIEAAVAMLAAAAGAVPQRPRVHYLLGLCHVRQGRDAEALADFRRFVELAPDDPDAEVARAWIETMS